MPLLGDAGRCAVVPFGITTVPLSPSVSVPDVVVMIPVEWSMLMDMDEPQMFRSVSIGALVL
jgi:hypothetical protein